MGDRLWTPPGLVSNRRQFLAGAAATALLAACGGDDGDGDGSGDASGCGPSADESDLSVVRFFGPYFAAGAVARVPFGLADDDGLLPADLSPSEVVVSVTAPDGTSVGDCLPATIHVDGVPRPYFTLEVTPPAPGFYDFTFDIDGRSLLSQFQVVAADDPTIAARVEPGEQMPAVVTPTKADDRGVSPICTRDPVCDLHATSAADVVGSGKLALLVSTPEFCSTVICGPLLELLLEVVPDFDDVTFVHAEVYTDPSANSTPPTFEDFAPVVGALGLPYEPVLFTVDETGTVVGRLDYVFDGSEIRRALDQLVG